MLFKVRWRNGLASGELLVYPLHSIVLSVVAGENLTDDVLALTYLNAHEAKYATPVVLLMFLHV